MMSQMGRRKSDNPKNEQVTVRLESNEETPKQKIITFSSLPCYHFFATIYLQRDFRLFFIFLIRKESLLWH